MMNLVIPLHSKPKEALEFMLAQNLAAVKQDPEFENRLILKLGEEFSENNEFESAKYLSVLGFLIYCRQMSATKNSAGEIK